ncbi:MAG: hypothetical protein Q7T57_08640 [Dehalococcoidales bacterium]|nr:hypothetical protein [Dehalococcoidales bacterium]
MLWINEREVPVELLELLGVTGLPIELKQEILNARSEVDSRGAVTYTTKARVEFYVHKYQGFLERLSDENNRK